MGDRAAIAFILSETGWLGQYQYTVGATPKTVTGQLGWNANGTLASLNITDQFNSANTQNCTYAHDDLVRLSAVNCGAAWSQTFGFDPFGNLTKSGSVSFQAGYLKLDNTTDNRIQSLPGFTPTYDANGNTTADSLHTYAWDAEGRPVTIDTTGLTYDALGRMAEQQNGSSYTEILYGPTGKMALMSGQTVTKALIPLTAGATAVYTAGPTLSYFRHSDWLGSSRFASTASRTMYYSGAYAPFGETYAEAGTPDRSFTGQNQDTIQSSTTGLYDFLYREHAQYGRWISPDPAGLAVANLSDPQSFNRYAYVSNRPTRYIDMLGLECTATPGAYINPDCVAGYTYGIVVYARNPNAEMPQDKNPSETSGNASDFYNAIDGLLRLLYDAVDLSSRPDKSGVDLPHGARKEVALTGIILTANNTSPCKGWSFGGTIGVNGEIGGGDTLAAAATGSAAFGVFKNGGFFNQEGTSLGAIATGGAFVGTGKTASPSQDMISPAAGGAYAGGGAGFFISNAGTPGSIGGHFATYTVDTPVVSVQFSKGGGIWSLSVTFGPGGLFGASAMTTNTETKTVAGSGTCVGG